MQGSTGENVIGIVAANAFMQILREQGYSDKEIVANTNDIFSRKDTFNNTDWYKSTLK